MIMKKNFSRWAVIAAGAVGLLASSCAYDPYYSDGGYGYYDGGGGSFSTSLFISTGDSRWGYDPYCNSYYDYHRRAYYDPFLYGYYPVGYRPPVIHGAPRPHGWSPGSRYCPPPSRITNRTLSNYRDREGAYRRSNFSWSNQVRQRDQGSSFQPLQSPDRGRQDSGRDFRNPSIDRSRDQNRNVSRPFPGIDQNRSSQRREDFTRPEIRRETPRVDPRADDSRRREFESRINRQRSENRGERRAPLNNPISIPQQREAPQRQAPQFDRSPARERNIEARPTPPQRSEGGSRGNFSRGDGDDRRGRR